MKKYFCDTCGNEIPFEKITIHIFAHSEPTGKECRYNDHDLCPECFNKLKKLFKIKGIRVI